MILNFKTRELLKYSSFGALWILLIHKQWCLSINLSNFVFQWYSFIQFDKSAGNFADYSMVLNEINKAAIMLVSQYFFTWATGATYVMLNEQKWNQIMSFLSFYSLSLDLFKHLYHNTRENCSFWAFATNLDFWEF